MTVIDGHMHESESFHDTQTLGERNISSPLLGLVIMEVLVTIFLSHSEEAIQQERVRKTMAER